MYLNQCYPATTETTYVIIGKIRLIYHKKVSKCFELCKYVTKRNVIQYKFQYLRRLMIPFIY